MRALLLRAANRTGTDRGKNRTGNRTARDSAFMQTAERSTPRAVRAARVPDKMRMVCQKWSKMSPFKPENSFAKKNVGMHVLHAMRKTKRNLAANQEKELMP